MNATYRAVVGNQNFVLIWLGQTTSQLGDSFYDIALVWLALQMTNRNPASVGVVIFARAVPFLFFGLLAGAYSDRWDRKRIMIVCDVLRGLTVLLLPLLNLLGALAFWHLVAVAFALTTLRTFFHPSLQASVPRVVPEEQLSTANAALHASSQVMTVLGPVVAGLLLTVATPHILFVFDSLTFGLSALTILLVRLPGGPDRVAAARPHVVREIVSTAGAVRRHGVVFWSITLFGLGLTAIAGLIRVGLPVFSTAVLHGGSGIYGLLMGVMGVGTVLGALLIGRVRTTNYGLLIFVGWMFWGAFFAALGATRWLPLALGLVLLAGVAEAVIDVPMVTLLQRSVPPTQLGKVFSFWLTVANVGDSLSGLLIGWLMGLLAVAPVFIGCGITTVAIGLFGLLQVSHAPTAATASLDDAPLPPGETDCVHGGEPA